MRKGGGMKKHVKKASAETQTAARRLQSRELLENVIAAVVLALAKLLLKDWLS